MKRFLAVFLAALLAFIVCFAVRSDQQSGPVYPNYSEDPKRTTVETFGEFLDANEEEIMEIYNFLMQQEPYSSVKYSEFSDGRVYYKINGDDSNAWLELPFREELIAFLERFQCTYFEWVRFREYGNLGPCLILRLVFAVGAHGNAASGNAIYCLEDPPERYITGTTFEVPGHPGWYYYVIIDE